MSLLNSPYRGMPLVSTVIRRAAALVLALAFVVTAYWSLRFAYADRLSRLQIRASLAEAAELFPGNADYRVRLAEVEGTRRQAELEIAVESNPYHETARIQLGLLAESDGDYEAAEQHLIEAARVDTTFTPRWTLASYYFRRQDESNFWVWARAAAEMSYGDTTALYRLCWRMTHDAELILERAIPQETEQLVRYLLFLMNDDHLEAGMEVSRLLMGAGGEQYLGILVGYCERLLITRDAERTVEAWNALIQHGLLPYHSLAEDAGRSLTNGEFGFAPLGRGFDWRLLKSEGVSLRHEPDSLRIALSGRQAEHCELLLEYMPLTPASAYRLRVEWGGQPPPANAGLRWHVADSGAGVVLPLEGDPPVFRTTPETRLGRLTLRYDRPRGAVRWQGQVLLERVELERTATGM